MVKDFLTTMTSPQWHLHHLLHESDETATTMKFYARKWPHKHQLHHLHHHRSLQPLTTNTTIYVINNNKQGLVPYLLRLARGPHQTLCTSPSSHIRLDRFICRKLNGNMTYPGQWRNKPNNATVSNQQNIMTKTTEHEDFLCWSKWCGKHVLVIALSRMGLNHSNNFLFLFYNISSLFANSHNTHQTKRELSCTILECLPHVLSLSMQKAYLCKELHPASFPMPEWRWKRNEYPKHLNET